VNDKDSASARPPHLDGATSDTQLDQELVDAQGGNSLARIFGSTVANSSTKELAKSMAKEASSTVGQKGTKFTISEGAKEGAKHIAAFGVGTGAGVGVDIGITEALNLIEGSD